MIIYYKIFTSIVTNIKINKIMIINKYKAKKNRGAVAEETIVKKIKKKRGVDVAQLNQNLKIHAKNSTMTIVHRIKVNFY